MKFKLSWNRRKGRDGSTVEAEAGVRRGLVGHSETCQAVKRRDYWGEALARLDDRNRQAIQQATEALPETLQAQGNIGATETSVNKGAAERGGLAATSWPERLLKICREQKQVHDTDETKFNFTGQQMSMQRVLDGLVKFLNRIKQVGDIAVNADPIHAGLPWAVIRFLLTVTILA
jgi:hypothetical protein